MEMLGHAQVVRANGCDIAWTELGEGPPLVLLHGLADSHRSFRRIAPSLARTHRVLMPDLPGHGYSERPSDAPYDPPWFARTMAAWMESIGVPQAAICGHSFGGGVALAMAIEHAERVERLALLAPGGMGREVSPWLRMSALPLARVLLGSLAARRIATRLAVSPLGPARFARPEPEELARYAMLAAMPGTAEALQRILDASLDANGQRATFWDLVDARATLPPIMVMWGELDPVLPFAHARRVAERLLHATVHAYPRCGHFPHLDCPERVLCDLAGFLGDAERPRCRLADGGCGGDEARPGWLDDLALAAE